MKIEFTPDLPDTLPPYPMGGAFWERRAVYVRNGPAERLRAAIVAEALAFAELYKWAEGVRIHATQYTAASGGLIGASFYLRPIKRPSLGELFVRKVRQLWLREGRDGTKL